MIAPANVAGNNADGHDRDTRNATCNHKPTGVWDGRIVMPLRPRKQWKISLRSMPQTEARLRWRAAEKAKPDGIGCVRRLLSASYLRQEAVRRGTPRHRRRATMANPM